jgi:hypothetical protein
MKQTSKRFFSMMLALAFITIAIILYFELIEPAYEIVQGMRADLLSRTVFIQHQQVAIKDIQEFLKTYKSQPDTESLLALALPSNDNPAGALTQLNGIAQNLHLTPQSFSVSLIPPQLAAAAQTKQGSSTTFVAQPLGSLVFQVKYLGAYEDFATFLKTIEANTRLFDLQNLSIQSSNNVRSPGYSFDVKVVAHYQKS